MHLFRHFAFCTHSVISHSALFQAGFTNLFYHPLHLHHLCGTISIIISINIFLIGSSPAPIDV